MAGLHGECGAIDQGPRSSPNLVVAQSKDLNETGVAEVAASALTQVCSNPAITPINEHLHPEGTRGFVQVDVLTVPLIAADVNRRRRLESSSMTQCDADGFIRNAAVEQSSAIFHEADASAEQDHRSGFGHRLGPADARDPRAGRLNLRDGAERSRPRNSWAADEGIVSLVRGDGVEHALREDAGATRRSVRYLAAMLVPVPMAAARHGKWDGG